MRFQKPEWGVAALLLAVGAGMAGAFVPPQQAAVAPILRPGSEIAPTWRTENLAASRAVGVDLFFAEAGGQWSVQWNPRTGTPHALYGSGFQVAGRIDSEAQAEAIARRFIAENRELLGVRDLAGLRLESVANGLGKWGVIFEQDHAGVPVDGGTLRIVMTETGRLYYLGSDWHPGVEISVRPTLGLTVARDLAAREVGFDPSSDVDHGGGLRILPVPAGEASMEYRLVWRTRLEVADPYAIWESFVDAQDGTILWRYNDVHYVNVVGTTAGNVEDFGYCYQEEDRRLPHMLVNVTGGNNAYSDANGNYTINHPGSTPVTVTAQLDGRWINVNNQGGTDATFSGTATPGVPFEIRWNDANSRDDERDVYLHGNRIHDIIKQYDPTWTPPDYRMSGNVNLSATCNAFWNGSSINFYRAGGGCGNTGQMGDVIYHEYGHGLTQWIYGNNPSDVGEGNSDIAAFLIDGNSITGEGFTLDVCTSGIRNHDNNLQYPADYQAGQIHFNGQIIGGFYWDSREVMVETYGESGVIDVLWPIWHFARRIIRPLSMPDQVLAAFVTDDDDGDLTNGTPHYEAFCTGAANHGFSVPGPVPLVTITHTPLHHQTFDGLPDRVTAVITSSAGAIDPSTVELQYRLNEGALTVVPMTPTGFPNEYEGSIPAVPVGSVIDYAIVAEDVNGNGGAYPTFLCTPGVPGGAERFYVATFVDEVEEDFGWVVNPNGDDNATTGIWERIDPNGTAAQPEDDKTPPPGIFAWVTGQCLPGCGLGDNDVDGGKTTVASPVYDLTGSANAKVVYYRWYSNDTGATPGTDFWVVEASNDGGVNWVTVENTNQSAARWTPIEVDLNALFGGPAEVVQFRFVASDEGAGSLVEAAVDEFLLFVDIQTDVAQEIPGTRGPHFSLLPARPNPFGSGTEIVFEVPTAMRVDVTIHDISGRAVRTLAEGKVVSGGQHILSWDGADGAGRDAAAGVYYVRFRAPGFEANRKIVLQR